MRTLAKFNPLTLFFVPGAILWGIGIAVAAVLFIGGPINGFEIHTIITGLMGALLGSQLIIISFVINLFTVGENDQSHSRMLTRLASHISHNGILFLGIVVLLVGVVWYAILVRAWRFEVYNAFLWTEELVFALSFIIGGFQLIPLAFILSQLKKRTSPPVSAKQARNVWMNV